MIRIGISLLVPAAGATVVVLLVVAATAGIHATCHVVRVVSSIVVHFLLRVVRVL